MSEVGGPMSGEPATCNLQPATDSPSTFNLQPISTTNIANYTKRSRSLAKHAKVAKGESRNRESGDETG